MTTALWIIAIAEIIRLLQNSLQLMVMFRSKKYSDEHMQTATDAFVKSLNVTDKQFIAGMLKKLEEEE